MLNIYRRVWHIQLIAIMVILLVCQYSLFTDISIFRISAPILVYYRTIISLHIPIFILEHKNYLDNILIG